MPCRAHKHWLPRFYAFDCFLGISPTALMRSLHPHRVGEQVTHPTWLFPPHHHSHVEPSPASSFPRRRESMPLIVRGNDGNRRQALRGNDGNRRQTLRGNNGNRRQALRGNDGNRRQALRGNDGNRRQARRKNDRVKALLPVQRVNTVLTARIKPIFLYFLRLLRSFCALCVLPPYPPPHSLPRSLCQPRFVACELLLHLGGCCAAQGVAGVE